MILFFSCDIVEIAHGDSLEIDAPFDLELARILHKNFRLLKATEKP
jgi:hypothetical protein